MTSKELNSWARYFQHEPTNSVEIQLAYLTYIVSAYMGAKNKKVDDYIITSYRPPKKVETLQDLLDNAVRPSDVARKLGFIGI